MLNIGLTYDLQQEYLALGFSEEDTAEFDSIVTIDAIDAALRALGHTTERIGNIWQLTQRVAKNPKQWDLIFNIAEGLYGIAREAQIPSLLEAYQIPYTFSPPEVLVTCHDKSLAKLLVNNAGLATAAWHVVKHESEISAVNLPYPLFVKPLAEGTGKGVTALSVVYDVAQLTACVKELLHHFKQPVLIETYLSGREFTVGLLGEKDNTEVIGVMEVIANSGAEEGGHTYHNKANCETLMEYRLANDETARKAGELAKACWKALGCRDGGRIDIRCDQHQIPHFLEVNPLAGLHPVRSDLVILSKFAGMNHQTLIERIVQHAISRYQLTDDKLIATCAS